MSKTYRASGNVSITYSHTSAEALRDYWTPERKAAAQPVEEVLFDGTRAEKTSIAIAPADISVQPFSTGGKMFFTKNGEDRVASAQFCGDKRIALTAAHCIRDKDTGAWSENVWFERAYRYGFSPGVYAANTLTCREAWTETKNYRWDFAFFVTDEPSPVTPLPFALQMPFTRVTQFGYPVAYDKGQVMQTSDGNITRDAATYNRRGNEHDLDINTDTGLAKMDNNPAGGGCSGGAWVGINTCTVASVNSFHYTSDPTCEYGPIFGAEFQSLYDFTKDRIY
jgi:hypothetical protein